MGSRVDAGGGREAALERARRDAADGEVRKRVLVEDLTLRRVEVIELRDVHGMSHHRIARALGASRSTVLRDLAAAG
ncbi:MAG: sigma factor-like helix-turn-helix DNA-binding protein [Acidimicrobiales bacterium]